MGRSMPDRRRRSTFTLPPRDFTASGFLNRIQIHGLSDFHQAKTTISKIFWGVIVAAFFALLAFGIYRCYMEYNDNPIISTSYLHSNSSMEFPHVFICPTNSMNYSNPTVMQNYSSIVRYVNLLPWNPVANDSGAFPPHLSMREANNIIKSIAIETNRFLLGCMFNFNNTWIQLKYCSQIATPVYQYDGICYHIAMPSFLPSSLKRQGTKGGGLILSLDFLPELYPKTGETTFHGGAEVKIGKPADFIVGLYTRASRGVYVLPGKRSKIDVTTRFVKLINYDKGKMTQRCCNGGEQQFQVLNTTYSKDACYLDCIQRNLLRECGCLAPTDTKLLQAAATEAKPCKLEGRHCLEPATAYTSEVNNRCEASCLDPCEEWTYNYGVSALELGPWDQIELKRKRVAKGEGLENITDIRSRFAIIDIAYASFDYWVTIQSEALSITGFISNIGGLTGLWLGASLLTVVQLVAAAASFVYTKLCNRCKRQNQKETTGTELDLENGLHETTNMASLM